MNNTTCGAELMVLSDLIYLRSVRSFVRRLAESAGFSHEGANRIELAVDEVFSNAVEHGSGNSRSQVAIRCSPTDELIRIIVSDTGSGSDVNAGWPDTWFDIVRKGAQPGAERGHGLFLAYSMTDKMGIESNSIGGVDVHLIVYREESLVAKG